jgi:hypothetical protein
MPWRSLGQACDRLATRIGLEPFTTRDIRRTVRTGLARIGVLDEIRRKVQNHALSDIGHRHYDRYDSLSDKRAALEGWALELQRILLGHPTSPTWETHLRRFVREPDNAAPGRRLEQMLDQGTAEVVEIRKTA